MQHRNEDEGKDEEKPDRVEVKLVATLDVMAPAAFGLAGNPIETHYAHQETISVITA